MPVAILAGGECLGSASYLAREALPRFAQVSVYADREGCAVGLDATPAGKTDREGALVLREVDPSDHYLHVHCPGRPETAYLISPRAGDKLEIRPGSSPPLAGPPSGSPLQAAEAKIRLRGLVHQAVRLRAGSRLEEAVQLLRDAARMDPDNSDLHRELGITFLLGKDWKRARVEMLEAIRHDPSDADAHNGLGYALEKLGDLEAALKEYRTANRLDPDDASYRQHYLGALGKLAAQQAEKKK